MAFPVIENVLGTIVGSVGDDSYYIHEITMPSLSSFNDVFIVFFTCREDNETRPSINTEYSNSEWKRLGFFASPDNVTSIFIYTKKDTHPVVLNINTDKAVSSTAITVHLSGAEVKTSSPYNYDEGTTNAPNPPSVSPSKGIQDYLFIAFAGVAGSDEATYPPNNYSSMFTVPSHIGGASSSIAFRNLRTSSAENPDTFTLPKSSPWCTATICVDPFQAEGPGAEIPSTISNLFLRH